MNVGDGVMYIVIVERIVEILIDGVDHDVEIGAVKSYRVVAVMAMLIV